MEPAILFSTSPPNLEELCGITVSVKTGDKFSVVNMQSHITKCREMIFTEPDILAGPSYDLDFCFNIVMLQSHFKMGRIQARLQKQGLQWSKTYKVQPSLYQSCLKYTVLAKLAPVWNRAGEWLIQGRDFLVHTGYEYAIKMNLCVNKHEVFMSLAGTAVRFPPLQVEELNLSQEEIKEVVKSTEDGIHEVPVADCWCHVLPSMKRGKIFSLSLTISRESPFISYRDLQRHWKNMYGYRLPDTDEDIMYCQVGFLPSGGGTHFTYPSICLRSGPLQIIPRVDPKPILTAFIQDIYSRAGSVCGSPLKFQPKLFFPSPSLHIAGQVTRQANLASRPFNKCIAPMRDLKSISHMFYGVHSDRKFTLKEKLQEMKNNKIIEQNFSDAKRTDKTLTDGSVTHLADKSCTDAEASSHGHDMLRDSENIQEKYSSSKAVFSQSTAHINNLSINRQLRQPTYNASIQTQLIQPTYSASVQTQLTQPASSTHKITPPKMVTKYVPHFRPKLKCQSSNRCSTSAASSSTVLNCFVPVTKQQALKCNFILSNERKTQLKQQTTEASEMLQMQTSKSLTTGNDTSDKTTVQNSSLVPKSVPHFRKHFRHHRSLINGQSHLSSGDSSMCNLKSHGLQQSPGNAGKASSVSVPASPSLVSGYITAGKLCTVKRQDICGKSMDRISNGMKKTTPAAERKGTPKKPRVKPQLDVESLARVDQLGKVNAVTLISWLKDRGVVCKSKDKKTDLVDRVKKYINSCKQ